MQKCSDEDVFAERSTDGLIVFDGSTGVEGKRNKKHCSELESYFSSLMDEESDWKIDPM